VSKGLTPPSTLGLGDFLFAILSLSTLLVVNWKLEWLEDLEEKGPPRSWSYNSGFSFQ
jgi:hypothetical protein